MPAEPTVVDATVLRGFALADRLHHLAAALGGPAAVCRAVWDPDEEPGQCDQGRSELTRSLTVQQRRAQDDRRSAPDRAAAKRISRQLATVGRLRDVGDLVIIDLDDDEEQLYARLVSTRQASTFRLAFPLAPPARQPPWRSRPPAHGAWPATTKTRAPRCAALPHSGWQ